MSSESTVPAAVADPSGAPTPAPAPAPAASANADVNAHSSSSSNSSSSSSSSSVATSSSCSSSSGGGSVVVAVAAPVDEFSNWSETTRTEEEAQAAAEAEGEAAVSMAEVDFANPNPNPNINRDAFRSSESKRSSIDDSPSPATSAPLPPNLLWASLMKLKPKWVIDGEPILVRHIQEGFDIICPATETVITRVPCLNALDVDEAVRSATAAFPTWSRTSGATRATYLRALAEQVTLHAQRLAKIESLNCGKPVKESEWDMSDVSGCLEYYANLAEGLDENSDGSVVPLPLDNFTGRIVMEPVGVVAAIIPWNYPLLMAMWKIAPALAAGCTIVLKPSEFTPLTALEFAELAKVVKLPTGVLNIITGTGPTVGSALVSHPLIDKVAFTGSFATGSRIMGDAAKQVKPVSLELGGKSAAIVFPDIVSIDETVEWILFGFAWTNGQICSATSRLLIHESIADVFISRLVAAAQLIPIGDPLSPALEPMKGVLGPLVNKQQYQGVCGYIDGAIKQGAVLLCGGSKRPSHLPVGYYVPPTIFKVTTNMTIWKEEVFGPVLSIVTFSDEQEAIDLANASEYGLAAAVFSNDHARCERVCRALRVGITWVNCSQPTFCQLPWGGMKHSGVGRELGQAGLSAYLAPKQITSYINPHIKWDWYDLSKLPALPNNSTTKLEHEYSCTSSLRDIICNIHNIHTNTHRNIH